ncbi:MAG: hypothetical protein AAF411_22070, partial [Myxococcota bacterium]
PPPTGLVELAIADLEPSHRRPSGAPAAVAYLPPDFDRSAPYTLVVFLHGWRGCARQLMYPGEIGCTDGDAPRAGWALGETLGGDQRVVLTPQLAFRRRTGAPGRFRAGPYVESFLRGALEELELAPPAKLALMAHSAGYETALRWIGSRLSIDAVLLMDALYGGTPRFADWVMSDDTRRLVSLTTGGSTGVQQRRLRQRLRQSNARERVLAERSSARHADVPAVDGARVLAWALR